MARRTAVALLLAAVTAAFATAAPVAGDAWVAALPDKNKAALPESVVAGRFDYRGRFGAHNVALFNGASAEALLANNFANIVVLDPLNFPKPAQAKGDFRLWALVALEGITAAEQEAVRTRLADRPHITVGDVTFAYLSIADNAQDWPRHIEDIPVPRRALRLAGKAPNSPVVKHAFNEIIAQSVARVSQEEMFETDLYLSSEEIFSRQSASEGLLVAAQYLQTRLRSFGLAVSTFDYHPVYGPVIVAELRGVRTPEQIVLVGAHYDSRSINSADPGQRAPGADDNGSGTSAIVEIARVMTSANTTYANTVRYLLFSGEEQGLLGSEAYAEYMVEQNAQVLAMFNADMLGYRIPGNPIEMGMKDRYITESLLEESIIISNTYVPDMPVKLSSSCCSDYRSFWEAGFPAIGYFENPTTASTYPAYHTSNDVIANVDFEQMQKETGAVLAMVMTYAVPL